MNPHVSVITIGVKDFNRAKRFYNEALGWPIQVDQSQRQFVSFSSGGGSSAVGSISGTISPPTRAFRRKGLAFGVSPSPTLCGPTNVSTESLRRPSRAAA
jgi:catechol 2,3-dioxygenase-like lactoylglutathione lyase family enzyme